MSSRLARITLAAVCIWSTASWGQAAPTPPNTAADVVILAADTLNVGQNVTLASGQLVVNNPDGNLVFKPGFNGGATSTQVLGNTVIAGRGRFPTSFFDVFANTFQFSNLNTTVLDQVVMPLSIGASGILPYPTVSITAPTVLDPCPVPARNDSVCRIRSRDGVTTLPQGNYYNLRIGSLAVVTFSGGMYNLNSLRVGLGARLLITTTTTINIADRFLFGKRAVLQPQFSDQLNPRCISINVGGTKVRFGAFSKVSATVTAPTAFMIFGTAGNYNGNFVAERAVVRPAVTLTDPAQLTMACP